VKSIILDVYSRVISVGFGIFKRVSDLTENFTVCVVDGVKDYKNAQQNRYRRQQSDVM